MRGLPVLLRYFRGDTEMVFRNYREEDYEALCGFLIELNRTDRVHLNWNWARFEWMMEHPQFDRKASGSIGLWLSGEKVVGAAVYDMYFGEAFCAALPEFMSLYPQILDYAFRALRDKAGLGVAIREDNEEEIRMAEKAGFTPAEQTETVMVMELDRRLPVALPEGFRFTELDPSRNAYAFQWLLWRGFDHGENRETFEREEKIVPQIRKHFNPRLSVAATDPAGENAAYCCLWYQDQTDYAYVEPVCTVPSCRGKGLASAVLRETLNRARDLGAKRAYVISDLPFYKTIGFQTAFRYSFYWKT